MKTSSDDGIDWIVELQELSEELEASEPLLKAIGDEMRQQLLLVMIRNADGRGLGMRVGSIAQEMNLSRPAVSHHLKILKECGLVKARREGTKNYYHFNRDVPFFGTVIRMLQHAQFLMQALPEES